MPPKATLIDCIDYTSLELIGSLRSQPQFQAVAKVRVDLAVATYIQLLPALSSPMLGPKAAKICRLCRTLRSRPTSSGFEISLLSVLWG